jgi:hypothetical protein
MGGLTLVVSILVDHGSHVRSRFTTDVAELLLLRVGLVLVE